jgi:hypothetical protein
MGAIYTVPELEGWTWKSSREVRCLVTGKVVEMINTYQKITVIDEYGGTLRDEKELRDNILPYTPSVLTDKDNPDEEGYDNQLNAPNRFEGDVVFSQEAIDKYGFDILNERQMIYWLKKGYRVEAASQLTEQDFIRSVSHDAVHRAIRILDETTEEIKIKSETAAEMILEVHQALEAHPDAQLRGYLQDDIDTLCLAVDQVKRVTCLP